MELSEFVKASLVQIIRGVADAIKETSNEKRTVINPSVSHAAHANPTNISFDIAVTVQETGSVKGGSSIAVFGTNFGVGGEKISSNSALSRINFSIPVAWPSVPKEQYPDTGSHRAQTDYDPFES